MPGVCSQAARSLLELNAPSSQNTGRTTHWMLLLKISIVALVIVFIVRAVRDGRAEFAKSNFSVANLRVGWLGVAGIAYSLGMLPMALNWHRLLRAMGQPAPRGATVRAHYLSQLGKYVPGKALVAVIRLGLLKPYQVDAATGVLSIFGETLAMMSIGAVLAGAIIAVQFRDRPDIACMAAAMAVLAGLPITPPILRFALRWMRRRRFAQTPDDHAADKLTWRVMVPGWLGITLGWCLLGVSMWATMKALNVPSTRDLSIVQLPWITASYAISVVAGFITMLPGGLGMREWVMMELVEPSFGPVVALLTPVLHRMMSLVSELVVSSILYLWGRHGTAAFSTAQD